ncbi:YmL10 [Friedmanniomyces endolithicus]|nr:YmL10 [Friedmanniomyces endolithicus]
MPPRLQILSRASTPTAHTTYIPLAPFLYPSATPIHVQQHQSRRSASILSQLSDTKGAYNKRIRVGRGPSSGYGKTSGRGHKGQKQHGKVPAGFNGGQTPDWVVSGTRGEKQHFTTQLSPINLNRIQHFLNAERLDPTQPITLRELARSRCLHGVARDGVKLLARGKEELTSAVHLVISRASKEAIAAVEKAGGSVTTRYYTPFAVKKVLGGQMDAVHSLQSRIMLDIATNSEDSEGAEASEREAATATEIVADERRRYRFRLPDPTSRKDLEYYRDERHRGYLSHMVAERKGPSLFFRTPGTTKLGKGKDGSAASKVKKVGGAEGGRVW